MDNKKNSGYWNTGYCNSISPDDCLIFNKPAKRSDWENAVKPEWIYVSLTEWIEESDMADKEKEAFPSYITTGGYLKVYESLKHAYIESWEKASKEDRELTFKLPNFDIEVFKEVFGFEIRISHTVIIDGKEIELSENSFNSLKESLTSTSTPGGYKEGNDESITTFSGSWGPFGSSVRLCDAAAKSKKKAKKKKTNRTW